MPKRKSQMKVPTAPKRKRDKEASKQKLFQAALEVFAQRGYDAATTKEIATKAGVSEGLIHRYYQSKAGLLLAIITEMQQEEHRPCALPSEKAESFEALIADYLKQSFEHCAADADFMRVAVSRSIVDPAISRQMASHLFDTEIPDFVEQLKSLQASGEIDRKEDLHAFALILSALGFSLGFLGQTVFGVPKKRLHDSAALFARVFARGLAPRK